MGFLAAAPRISSRAQQEEDCLFANMFRSQFLRLRVLQNCRVAVCRGLSRSTVEPPEVPVDDSLPTIPKYQHRQDEPTQLRKARLLYQSRKRGMLENGILLSCFADKHLAGMDDAQVEQFDDLINQPSNDWDIYHWITGKEPTPPEYQSDVMTLLKEFVQNKNKESRLRQPDI